MGQEERPTGAIVSCSSTRTDDRLAAVFLQAAAKGTITRCGAVFKARCDKQPSAHHFSIARLRSGMSYSDKTQAAETEGQITALWFNDLTPFRLSTFFAPLRRAADSLLSFSHATRPVTFSASRASRFGEGGLPSWPGRL
jgi:hypothetical protein